MNLYLHVRSYGVLYAQFYNTGGYAVNIQCFSYLKLGLPSH